MKENCPHSNRRGVVSSPLSVGGSRKSTLQEGHAHQHASLMQGSACFGGVIKKHQRLQKYYHQSKCNLMTWKWRFLPSLSLVDQTVAINERIIWVICTETQSNIRLTFVHMVSALSNQGVPLRDPRDQPFVRRKCIWQQNLQMVVMTTNQRIFWKSLLWFLCPFSSTPR